LSANNGGVHPTIAAVMFAVRWTGGDTIEIVRHIRAILKQMRFGWLVATRNDREQTAPVPEPTDSARRIEGKAHAGCIRARA
jgi:hypothetical protein